MAKRGSSTEIARDVNLERAAVIFGFLVLALGIFLWWQFVFSSAERTFWGMVNNNLQTRGITRYIKQEADDGKLEQTMQLELGAQNLVKGETVIEQQDMDGKMTRVVAESLATTDVNYSRYTDVSTGQKSSKGKTLDFGPLLGVWGKEEVSSQSQTQGGFSEVAFSAIPFAYLDANSREAIIGFMRESNTYDINFADAKKEELNGRQVYRYKITVNPVAYVSSIKKIDKAMGLNELGEVDANAYAASPQIQMEVVVDIISRQLVEVIYGEGQRSEYYSGYGVHTGAEIPASTVSRQELELRLNELLQ